jgi:N-methylhydantoinase A/oxoprolinase/acetone carboxylase beta subunit
MRIGFDIGGTFTDALFVDEDGRLKPVKTYLPPCALERQYRAAQRGDAGPDDKWRSEQTAIAHPFRRFHPPDRKNQAPCAP